MDEELRSQRAEHRPPPLANTAHEEAIAQAEAKRLLRALAFVILSRDALEQECHAATWHHGSFTEASSAAVAAGILEALPGGFYRDARRQG